jgi:hypothetical protein
MAIAKPIVMTTPQHANKVVWQVVSVAREDLPPLVHEHDRRDNNGDPKVLVLQIMQAFDDSQRHQRLASSCDDLDRAVAIRAS